MNTDHLSLQKPDELNNKVSSFSSVAETPVLNPNPIRTEDTEVRKNKNFHLSVEIPRWRTFNDTNNEIPTMDASPMYATNCPTKGELFSQAELPEFRSRKNYTQNPIVSEKHNGTNNTNNTNNIDESYPPNDHNSNSNFLIRCCEYIFSWFI
jgi:hypothetical protein